MAQAPDTAPRHANSHPLTGLVLVTACLGAGLCAALGLAWMMYVLIESSEMRLEESDRAQMLDFVRIRRDETADRKNRKPERPKASEVPDIPPTDQSSDSGPQLALNVTSPTDLDADLDLQGGIGTGDGDYLPIVKVAPIYPRAALSRGLKGECLVRYTVTTADGERRRGGHRGVRANGISQRFRRGGQALQVQAPGDRRRRGRGARRAQSLLL